MKPLTPSEQALVAYFYTIATDPGVKAAGFSPTRLKDAVLARASRDLSAVTALMLRGAAALAEPKITKATGNVARTILGGTVSSKAAEEFTAGIETLVKDGFKGLTDWFDKKTEKKK